jgi:hypothetical protein
MYSFVVVLGSSNFINAYLPSLCTPKLPHSSRGASREPLYVEDYFKPFISSTIADNLYRLDQYACARSVQLETFPEG